MVLLINRSKFITVNESCLKYDEDKRRLYNKDTKEYEGVDGDSVTFVVDVDGKPCQMKGTIEGHSCGSSVKIRGIDASFDNVREKYIEHVSAIELVDKD